MDKLVKKAKIGKEVSLLDALKGFGNIENQPDSSIKMSLPYTFIEQEDSDLLVMELIEDEEDKMVITIEGKEYYAKKKDITDFIKFWSNE